MKSPTSWLDWEEEQYENEVVRAVNSLVAPTVSDAAALANATQR